MEKARKAFCIPVWFDPDRGHEGSKHGKQVMKPLDWYRSPVHSGSTVRKLAQTIGIDRAARVVFLYDQLCQITASQARDRRGWVLDRRGTPMSIEDLGRELNVQVPWLTEVIDDALQCKWIEWRPLNRALSGSDVSANGRNTRDEVRKSSASSRKSSECLRQDGAQIQRQRQIQTETEIQSKKQTERPPAAAGRIGSLARGSGSGQVGPESVGSEEPPPLPGSSAEYALRVRQILFPIADTALLARVVNRRIGLDELEVIRREYDEAKKPDGCTSSRYLHGMLQRRGYLPKQGART